MRAATNSSPEVALVCRARNGDRSAFDQLVAQYRAPLLAMAFVRTGHRDEAEDLVQEIWEKAWRGLPTLQHETAFASWLKTLAANACNSWYRRARPPLLSLQEDTDGPVAVCSAPLPMEVVLRKEAERALREALATLPAANRMALLMLVWGGHSYQEIAQFTGVEPKTVEGRIRRAKMQLRTLLRAEASNLLDEYARPPAANTADKKGTQS